MPVVVLAVNHAQLAPHRQTAQMQIASIEGARMCIRPSERFFFAGVLCPVEEYGIHLHYIALGHERNKAEVKAAEFSAPIAIFVVVCCTVHLGQKMLLFTAEMVDKLCEF